MTGNKIPRWLSEGISVYEEGRRDPRWGQRMNAEYRVRVLAEGGKVTPVSQLSSAFLTASDGSDLNFAYYESSMVVEHIVTEFGIEALIKILQDLKEGLQINDALERHTNGLDELQASFLDYFRNVANGYAPDIDFVSKGLTDLAGAAPQALEEFVQKNPSNFTASMLLAVQLMEQNQLEKAESILKVLVEKVPDDVSVNGPRRMLAKIYQIQQNTTAESEVLSEHLARTADDLTAVLRLQELCEQLQDDGRIVELGWQAIAIDPFQTDAIVRMCNSAERLGDSKASLVALQSLLQLQPNDAARLHYRLAVQAKGSDQIAARRHVLLALQEAPRYRDAHKLLLELTRTTSDSEEATTEQNESAVKDPQNAGMANPAAP